MLVCIGILDRVVLILEGRLVKDLRVDTLNDAELAEILRSFCILLSNRGITLGSVILFIGHRRHGAFHTTAVCYSARTFSQSR